ncbi:13585_t:CDS:2 [Cetraspora pellucida]|uniref:13585_t:CDS:1 n=1 Tax=Cetraspora pellucida TaxID=1433469 RepID=A0ACA9MGF0_9GLOM|nr:13585_t:CDS:2 [Cetraspora pellucida]
MLIDQEDFDDGNLNSLSPYMIMHSGLHDIKFVNDAMFHLFLANNLTKKNQNQETMMLRKQEKIRQIANSNDFKSNKSTSRYFK